MLCSDKDGLILSIENKTVSELEGTARNTRRYTCMCLKIRKMFELRQHSF